MRGDIHQVHRNPFRRQLARGRSVRSGKRLRVERGVIIPRSILVAALDRSGTYAMQPLSQWRSPLGRDM
jgi:hypothetical protein